MLDVDTQFCIQHVHCKRDHVYKEGRTENIVILHDHNMKFRGEKLDTKYAGSRQNIIL